MKTSIQLTLLTVLALTATSAFADFRPGRVRAGVVSDMRTVEADGIYEREPGARVELNFEDGKAAPVSITLKLDNKEAQVLPILAVEKTGCGDTYSAHSNDATSVGGVALTLVDYSNIQCRLFVANKFHVSVTKDHGRGQQQSHLKLEGQPEFLAVTLTTRR